MTFDWQILLVALVIIMACMYVARRLFQRVKSLTSKSGDDSCASGCGSCGSATTNKQPGIIQITRQTTIARRQ